MRLHPARWLVRSALSCALGACASGPERDLVAAPAVPSSRGVASTDHRAEAALELAERLPAGADRCSFARPQRIDARQKTLAKQVMQSDALAWDPALAVTAFASADRARDDGPAARVIWLRSQLPIATLQRRLDTKLAIDWQDAPCSVAPCPLRGAVIDGAVLLSSERWPQGLPPGAEAECVRAGRDRRALELSAARLVRMPFGGLLGLPLCSTTSVLLASDALVAERVEIMADRAEAGDRAMRARGGAHEHGFGFAASELRVEQEDVLVRTTARYRWDDLELRAEDAARLLAAERAARLRLEQEAPARDGPLEPGDYLARAAHLLLQLNDPLAPEQSARRQALHQLLEDGLAEHPEQEPIAFVLFELRMAEPGRRALARELAERFAAMPGSDPRWQDAVRTARAAPVPSP